MIWIEEVRCIHGIEIACPEHPERDCEQCADAIQYVRCETHMGSVA